jgi:hypothetical protein
MGLIILTSSPAPRASSLGFEWRIFPQWHSWQCSSMHQFTLRRMVELGLLLGSVACLNHPIDGTRNAYLQYNAHAQETVPGTIPSQPVRSHGDLADLWGHWKGKFTGQLQTAWRRLQQKRS